MYKKLLACASLMLVLGAVATAQTPVPGVAAAEEPPAAVTICQLKSDPAAYNHKLVEVTGFVSHAFEDFTVFEPTCPSYPGVWLEYGGKAKSGTMYCCGVTADRHRPKGLKIEDISIPLVDNINSANSTNSSSRRSAPEFMVRLCMRHWWGDFSPGG